MRVKKLVIEMLPHLKTREAIGAQRTDCHIGGMSMHAYKVDSIDFAEVHIHTDGQTDGRVDG